MEFTARQIAELVGGRVDGDPETRVNKLSKIEEARSGSLTFLANPAYTAHLYTSSPSLVIVSDAFKAEQELPAHCSLIRVADPHQAFATLLNQYNQIARNKTGRENPCYIASSATIGSNEYIGAFAYIGQNVTIGDNVKIYPQVYIGDNVTIGSGTTLFSGVKIYSDCQIGSDCTIHSGAIIGADGFGFNPDAENNYKKVAQIGNVVIEDQVEIGSNTTIDRATLGSTRIRKGVKMDNLIQVAHNVEIGENTVIAAQAGIAGSAKIGKGCMIGGQVGIVGHITIADHVKIAAQSGIGSSITNEGEIVQGSPGFNIGEYKRAYVVFKNLPGLSSKVDDLEKKVKKAAP